MDALDQADFLDKIKSLQRDRDQMAREIDAMCSEFVHRHAKFTVGERVLALVKIIDFSTWYPCEIRRRHVGDDGEIWYDVQRYQGSNHEKPVGSWVKVSEANISHFEEGWLTKPLVPEKRPVPMIFPHRFAFAVYKPPLGAFNDEKPGNNSKN